MATRKRNAIKANKEEHEETGHFLLSAAAGALVGAIAVYALTRKNNSTVNEYKESISDYFNPPAPSKSSTSHPLLILGAIAGTILGASLLYYQQAKCTKAKGFACSIKEAAKNFQNLDWIDIAKEFAETLREKANPDAEEEEIEIPRPQAHQNRLNDVIDWAVIGLRLWNNLKR